MVEVICTGCERDVSHDAVSVTDSRGRARATIWRCRRCGTQQTVTARGAGPVREIERWQRTAEGRA